MLTNVDRYWKQYLTSIPADSEPSSSSAGTAAFGIRWSDAGEIAALVLSGTKPAGGTLIWSNEADGTQGARPGDRYVVIAGPDEPVCIIETTEVRIFPYDEVPDEYAWEGGEGDRTVRDWRRIYWKYIVS